MLDHGELKEAGSCDHFSVIPESYKLNRRMRRAQKRLQKKHKAAQKILFEPLEPRVLLSADPARELLLGSVTDTFQPQKNTFIFQQQLPENPSAPAIDMAVADPYLAPLGSLIHTSSVSADFSAANETDSYTVNLDAGQNLTVGMLPNDASLVGNITVLDPDGVTTLGTAASPSPGAAAMLQNVPVSETGIYTIQAHNASGTGAYDAVYWLNAAVETEHMGGTADNDPTSAIDLGGSAVSLPDGADRLGAVGRTDNGTPDLYKFDLKAGQTVTLMLTATQSVPDGSAASLKLLNSGGNTLIQGETTGSNNIDSGIHNFIAPTDGIYYARVSGFSNIDYTLVVTRNADFEQEPNDASNQARLLDGTTKVLGHLAGSGGIYQADQGDQYLIQVTAGDVLDVYTSTPGDGSGEPVNDLDPVIELFNAAGASVASNDNAIGGDGHNAHIIYTAATSGAYRVRVAPVKGSGDYILTVKGAIGSAIFSEIETNDTLYTATALPLSEDLSGSGLFIGRGLGRQDPAGSTYTDPDYWRFEALAGDVVSVSVDTPKSGIDTYVQIHNAADSYVTYDYSSGPDGDAFISHYTIPTSGTYYVKVGNQSNFAGEYELHVELARGIQQETDGGYGNDSLSGANVLTMTTAGTHRTATITGTVMGPENSNTDEDYFNLGVLNTGNTVELNFRQPSDSTLIPRVTLRDSSGAAVSDLDGNPDDGHVLATIAADGTYYAQVESRTWAHNGHEYRLTGSGESWTAAEAEAVALGGHLVTVNDAAEQQWLTSTFGPLANLWIGYTDQGSENAWYWSSGEAATYTNWASGRPYANTTSYNHAYMGSNGQWNDYVNSYSPQGIIELPWAGGEAGPGSYAQYLLDVDTADLVPPRITSVTGLPEAGATMGETVQSFSLTLSEAMASATVNAGNRMVWNYGGHFYTLTQTSGSWTAAETEAQALGGHLVTVNDGTEQEWLRQNFERFGTLWIGYTDQAKEGTWVWADGATPGYTNWASGEPNSGNDYDWAYMESGNQWRDGHGTYSYRGIIELTGTDTDADGLPASVDPYPSDPLNAWDLREAGADNTFDSTDDIIYRLTLASAYTGAPGFPSSSITALCLPATTALLPTPN